MPMTPEKPSLVVMGVSGSGKSTLGRMIAARLGIEFLDGDDFHSAENVAKMAAGTPLTDDDRAPWLDRLAGILAARRAEGKAIVLACSSLRRRYRDRLRAGSPLVFVYIAGDASVFGPRMAAREGHFMPAALLESQLRTLEPPGPDEDVITIDGAGTTGEQVEEFRRLWAERA
jgi:carbohydrate kinase (thermoresistant glucokinase family)